MQFEYQNDKVKNILCDNKELQRKVGLEMGKMIKKRMNQLCATEDFNEYMNKIKFGNPHRLSGDLSNYYGISISGNYRLIIEPLEDFTGEKKCKIIRIKGVLDYHGEKYEWIIP